MQIKLALPGVVAEPWLARAAQACCGRWLRYSTMVLTALLLHTTAASASPTPTERVLTTSSASRGRYERPGGAANNKLVSAPDAAEESSAKKAADTRDKSANPGAVVALPQFVDEDPGHGWLVTADNKGGRRSGAVVWHVPPRGPAARGGVSPGSIRLAGDVATVPSAIAAVGDRLFIIFDDTPELPPAGPREVVSLAATRVGFGSSSEEGVAQAQWATRPTGRLDAAPSLRGDGQLLHAVGTQGAVWVLLHGLRDNDADPTALALYRLCVEMPDATWVRMSLPPEMDTYARSVLTRDDNRIAMPLRWRLVSQEATNAAPASLLIVVQEDEDVKRVWRGTMIGANSGCGAQRIFSIRAPAGKPTQPVPTGPELVMSGWATWQQGMLKADQLNLPSAPDARDAWTIASTPDGALLAVTPLADGKFDIRAFALVSSADDHEQLVPGLVRPLATLPAVALLGGVATAGGIPEQGPAIDATQAWNSTTEKTPPAPGTENAVPEKSSVDSISGVSGVVVARSVESHEASSVLVLSAPNRTGASRMIGGGREVTEVSATTGRVLAVKILTPQSPISSADYGLMGLFMVVVVGGTVMFVLRPPGLDRLRAHLPAQTSLADPLSRILAAFADLLVGCVIGTGLWALPPRVLLAAQWWSTPQSLWVAGTILLVLVVVGTLCEALFGRSLGKMLTGLRVVPVTKLVIGEQAASAMEVTNAARATSSRDGDSAEAHKGELQSPLPRPTLRASLVRNAIKWLAPVAVLAGLGSRSRRHRGDEWAATAVVQLIDVEDTNDADEDQDSGATRPSA